MKKFQQIVRFIDMSYTESRVFTKKAGIPMRTETEMFDLILQTAKSLKVEAVAMSGSRTDTKAPKDEFQDYDVVYVVDDLDNLTSNLAWLDQFGTRIIEQHNILGNRRLYLMLFEDGNRIDLTLCPKDHIQEWVESEADFTVLEDPKGLFEFYSPSPQRFWTSPASQIDFEKACNEFWWVSAYVVKGIHRKQVIYATDHLYGICQQELLKVLACQVASDRGEVDIGKNYKYLFQYLPAEKEKEFSALLDFSSVEKLTQSLFATMQLFHREAQILAQKMGFDYDKEVAEKMIQYAEERLSNH
ncbi:aminoglycoside adenylyltransferase [Streptococcus oralis subsp. oralis]|uniref:Aminoglycoside adenylyltransferase n=2 Tax=Streptococcus oralis TaxID=1303 RepID=A0A1X1HJ86_STROR|nr:aminoglycoside adenylyltransferase [Streptococcus oralis subsp. oralis]